MRRNFWLAALVGVALTGCVNEEIAPEAKQKEVLTFSAPVMATQSRANVMGEITGVKYPQNEDFKVFCKIYEGDYAGWTNTPGIVDYFDEGGEVAKHEGGTYWSTHNTVYYWPDEGYNLAFAAYSPAVLGIASAATLVSCTETGIQITNFVSEPTSDAQYDLMYSQTVYDRNKSNNASAAVAITFEHALSSIVFSSQKSDDAADYKITDLKVTGTFYTKGDFNQGITATTSPYTESAVPVWGLKETTEVTYVPTFAPFNVPAASPEIFTQGTSAILAIPQGVPTNAKVHVTYEKTSNGTTTTHTAELFLKDFQKAAEGTNPAEGINTWDRGKRYVYRIAFGKNQRIYFEPSTTDWVQEKTLIYTIQ